MSATTVIVTFKCGIWFKDFYVYWNLEQPIYTKNSNICVIEFSDKIVLGLYCLSIISLIISANTGQIISIQKGNIKLVDYSWALISLIPAKL